jgi:hypothetical protein
LGRRIAQAFLDMAEVIEKDVREDVPLIHRVQTIELRTRRITDTEYAVAKKVYAEIAAKKERGAWDAWINRLCGGVCERYAE